MMLNWFAKLGQKVDHPMSSVAATERLLADLPDDPRKALEEITSWLATITTAEGFRWPTRVAVARLLDETGRELAAQLTQRHLTAPAVKTFERLQLWQATLEFWQRLANAYRLCIAQAQADPKLMLAQRSEVEILIVRTQRALAGEAKVLYLRYLPGREKLWQPQFELYQLSESLECANTPLKPYADEVFPTTARHELLRALMLNAASPQSMQPRHIELAARVTARLASSCTLKTAAESDCYWYIDLAHPARPERYTHPAPVSATTRYIGPRGVIAKIEEMIHQLVADPRMIDKRFGDEYPPREKIAILKYLMRWWGENPPSRQETRRPVKADIEVAHGMAAACRLALSIKSGRADPTPRAANLSLGKAFDLDLASEAINAPPEKWVGQNATAWGVGVDVPRSSESWIAINALCTIERAGMPWWIGVVRWLNVDNKNLMHAGLEIFAKRPLAAWIRVVGEATPSGRNRAMSPDAFGENFLNVLFLDETAPSAFPQEMLMPRASALVGAVYDVLTTDAERQLKIEELLEQGDDFARVRYRWLKGSLPTGAAI